MCGDVFFSGDGPFVSPVWGFRSVGGRFRSGDGTFVSPVWLFEVFVSSIGVLGSRGGPFVSPRTQVWRPQKTVTQGDIVIGTNYGV